MPEDTDRLCFTLERELDGARDDVHETVQLLPSGEISPRGKSPFIVDELSRKEIIEAFEASTTDLVVDYEHQSLSGSEAPAAGWVRELHDRGEDGVWAKVEWTARAAEYLAGREYRYISPVVLIRKSDGRAVELLGAALTNLPAIEGMEPVVNKSVCRECGLPADSGPADGKFADMYKGVMGLLGLPGDARPEDAEAAILSLKSAEGCVPESEYKALKAELVRHEAETLIKEALSDGRLTPALAGWARSYAASDIDGFRRFIGAACPMVPLSRVSGDAHARIDGPQAGVNALLGISDEKFARYYRREI